MAVSYSRPDPRTPAAVAAASFDTVRKGFDPLEVREYLQKVSAEMATLLERINTLEHELRQAKQTKPPAVEDLDAATVTTLLGEETARVLSTARESAAQIRAKAEESSERLLREAQADAARIREEAELETARKRQDATRDADAELDHAKAQGREMVAEARAYREKVLADLQKRRELARQQLLQLAGAGLGCSRCSPVPNTRRNRCSPSCRSSVTSPRST
ncbi:MAG: DivIVA domain-containing protein [Ilumatobacteraceae bacterium]